MIMKWNYESYILTSIVFIICVLIIMRNYNRNIGNEIQIRYFRRMLIVYLLYALCDLFWAMGEYGLIPFGRLANQIDAVLLLISILAAPFFWFLYVADCCGLAFVQNRKQIALFALPGALIAAMDTLSAWTGWSFWISEENRYMTGPLYAIHVCGSFIYLILAAVISIRQMQHVRSAKERKKLFMYASFLPFFLLATILDGIFSEQPITLAGLFISLLLLTVNFQDMRISTDALTGLNNRGRMDEYLFDVIRNANESRPVTLFLLDVDHFKRINDQYGHISGDLALRIIGRAIAAVAREYMCFAARFGGDEFVLVVEDAGNVNPKELCASIQRSVDQFVEETEELPFSIKVSVGYASTTDKTESEESLLYRADTMLYQEKNKKFQPRKSNWKKIQTY